MERVILLGLAALLLIIFLAAAWLKGGWGREVVGVGFLLLLPAGFLIMVGLRMWPGYEKFRGEQSFLGLGTNAFIDMFVAGGIMFVVFLVGKFIWLLILS